MTKRDYYDILGVAKDADTEEIKRAYRKAAHAHHPDKNPGDKKAEGRFHEATEAYQVLSDPQKREAYNRYGHAGVDSSGFSGSASGFSDVFEGIFEDFFSAGGGSAFGGGGKGSRRAQRGDDLRVDLEVTFEEAAFGVEKTVTLTREESCGTCSGDGAKPGTSRKTCPVCRGSGQVLASSGFFSIARACTRCQGSGSLVEQPCTACRGSGRVAAERKLQVRVPPGIDNNLRMRMTGEGEAGAYGGPRGDLYIDMHVQPHEIFRREGDNIVCEVPISFVQAALGAEIEVPTLAGGTLLKIPGGTQNGKVFRLKGKGLASLKGTGIGDEEVHIVVETPSQLSEDQKELLRRFAELSGDKVNPISNSFVQKAKNLFGKETKR